MSSIFHLSVLSTFRKKKNNNKFGSQIAPKSIFFFKLEETSKRSKILSMVIKNYVHSSPKILRMFAKP